MGIAYLNYLELQLGYPKIEFLEQAWLLYSTPLFQRLPKIICNNIKQNLFFRATLLNDASSYTLSA